MEYESSAERYILQGHEQHLCIHAYFAFLELGLTMKTKTYDAPFQIHNLIFSLFLM